MFVVTINCDELFASKDTQLRRSVDDFCEMLLNLHKFEIDE